MHRDPAARERALDRVAGAVLGAAVGDALGQPVEFLTSMAAIRQAFGPAGVHRVRPPLAGGWTKVCALHRRHADGRGGAPLTARPPGSRMSRSSRPCGGWDKASQRGPSRPSEGTGPRGRACLRGSRQLARGRAWDAGDPKAGGCGSVMRAYPFGLLFQDDETKAEAWAASHSRLTHGHPMALAACAAMAVGVARAVKGRGVRDILDGIEESAGRYDGATAELCRTARADAEGGPGPEDVLSRLLGWNAREAIAAAVYVFARHSSAPRAALLEAVNTPGDSDSVGALVGALVGAVHGLGRCRRPGWHSSNARTSCWPWHARWKRRKAASSRPSELRLGVWTGGARRFGEVTPSRRVPAAHPRW